MVSYTPALFSAADEGLSASAAPASQLKPRGRPPSAADAKQWPAALSLIAYGVRIGIRANSREILGRCTRYLPVGWKPSSSETVDRLYSIDTNDLPSYRLKYRYQLQRDGRTITRSDDETTIFERLESDSALYVAEMSSQRVFVHAGVVGWHGKAILIPGRSHAGKSTLTAALVHAGASYYSDEFAVIDQNGRVHPYARPLQIRPGRGERQVRLAVEEIGGLAGRVPLPIGLILLCRFRPMLAWKPRHLSPGEALLGILGNTVSAQRAPAAALRALKPVVSSGFAVKGVRGDAKEVVDWVTHHFSQPGDWAF